MVESRGGQAQAAPLAGPPHADAAGVDLGATMQEVYTPHAINVGSPIVLTHPIGDMIYQPGAVLDLPFLQALSLTPRVERQRRVAVGYQMQRQGQDAPVTRHFHDRGPSMRRGLTAGHGIPGADA